MDKDKAAIPCQTISLESDDELELETITEKSDTNEPSQASNSINAEAPKYTQQICSVAREEPRNPNNVVRPLESSKKQENAEYAVDEMIICIDDEDTTRTDINNSDNSSVSTNSGNSSASEEVQMKRCETSTDFNVDGGMEQMERESKICNAPEDMDGLMNEDERDSITISAKNGNKLINRCCYLECKKTTDEVREAPEFALYVYEIPPTRGNQKRYLCIDCFEFAVQQYEKFGTLLINNEPLFFEDMPRVNENVELILDSSEEEDELTYHDNDEKLPESAIRLIESELEDVVESMLEKCNVNQQVDWAISNLQKRIQRNEETSNKISEEFSMLTKTLDNIHENIYSTRPTKVDTPELSIMDDQTCEQVENERMLVLINNSEPLRRPAVKINQTYYALKQSLFYSWVRCRVKSESPQSTVEAYNIQFLEGAFTEYVRTAKQLAYLDPPTTKLRLGTRVIAKSHPPNSVGIVNQTKRGYYAGVVIEPISSYNRYRYLITFDSGQTYYVPFSDVRVVCDESKHVWEDVHPHLKDYIRSFMQTCTRPMVQVKQGQRLKANIGDKWHTAMVIDVDASLVHLFFPTIHKYEWIYRGSQRLAPLYRSANATHAPNSKFSKFQKRNEPSIEYITIDDDENESESVNSIAKKSSVPSYPAASEIKREVQDTQQRAIARKSTSNRDVTNAVSMNKSTIYIDCDKDRPNGTVFGYTTKNYPKPQKFVVHECNPGCLYPILKNIRPFNLLARPLVTGWERHICSIRNQKRCIVYYRAPCGRRLRNMKEVHHFLRTTDSGLNVEHFDFDPDIRALSTFRSQNTFFEIKDLSFGAECMPVQCVNNYDDTKPPPCNYSTERIPTEGVNLNLEKEFLCGCDCEDDCSDKNRCQCWQLTIAGVRYKKPNEPIDKIGYVYKRLSDSVLTGIYECNSQCRCNVNKCLNRVVQHPLETKLQVFNTKNKGWGIRCLNDVPKGSFICIYAGHLITEEMSNKICAQNEDKTGDEYFADLDFIETVDSYKRDYEKDAYQSSLDGNNTDESEELTDNEEFPSKQDSDEEYTSKSKPTGMVVKTRAQLRKSNNVEKPKTPVEDKPQQNDNDEQERVSLIPNAPLEAQDKRGNNDVYKFRKLFGKDEQVYIMDAKKSGNLGRYFNHSCVPNLFVQNVFVDTHDLRFPWVTFFAARNIQAGTELTWNYNYDVGSVRGKVLTCNCGEKRCNGRLL